MKNKLKTDTPGKKIVGSGKLTVRKAEPKPEKGK